MSDENSDIKNDSDAMSISDGECSASEIEEDPKISICEICNLTFKYSKEFHDHLQCVSHLSKASEVSCSIVEHSSQPVSATATGQMSNAIETLVSQSLTSLRYSQHGPSSKCEAPPCDPWYSSTDTTCSNAISVTENNHHTIEPLIDGHWVMKLQPMDDVGFYLNCHICSVRYNNRLLYDIHMAGLRHMKSCPHSARTDQSPSKTIGKTLTTGTLERNVDLFQQLSNFTETEPAAGRTNDLAAKKMKVSDMLERNVGLFQQLTHLSDQKPIVSSSSPLSAASSHVLSPQSVGEFSHNKNKLSNVERNVNLFKKLSNCVEHVAIAEDIVSDEKRCHEDRVALRQCEDNSEEAVVYEQNAAEVEQEQFVNKTSEDNADSQIEHVNNGSDEVLIHDESVIEKVPENVDTNIDLFLNSFQRPVLGADYLSEYRFQHGSVDCLLCDLCDTRVSDSVAEHASNFEHILRYLFYHDSEAFKQISMSGRLSDSDCFHQVASAVEQKHGRRLQPRVFLETDKASEIDGGKSWVEQPHDEVRPISGLLGHRMNLEYSTRRLPSDWSTPISDVPTLLDYLATQSCLSQCKPPQLRSPINRLHLLCSIAKFDIKNDSDAEVCLQMANFLTLSVLNYRMQMLPGLRPADRAKYEGRLERLIEGAELVATKASSRELTTEQPVAVPPGDSTILQTSECDQ